MQNNLKPMPLPLALLYFGVPALSGVLIVYAVMPFFAARGMSFFFNYVLTFATIPMLVLIAAALFFYRREGNRFEWLEFKNRFRLNQMNGKAWLWTIGLTLFMFLSAGLLSFTGRWLAANVFAVPEYWPPELNPSRAAGPTSGALPTEFMGMSLAGNWWILIVLLVSLVIATLGEELWWRGYILPRQELVHGKKTWLVHGLLWTGFHAFAPWNLLAILPGCLALPFVAQRLGNTLPGIIAHGLANGLLVIIVVVLGIMG